jgi:NADPH:quinone reductase-like Zn-dependent oxidoreductase/SAM-dependent methyltransferase
VARAELLGLRGAYAHLQIHDQSGNVVVDVDRLRYVSHTDFKAEGEYRQPFSSPFWRLSWRPDVRSLSDGLAQKLLPGAVGNGKHGELLALYERLAAMIIVETSQNLAKDVGVDQAPHSIRSFLRWMTGCAEGDNEYIFEAKELDGSKRKKKISGLTSEMPDSPEFVAFGRLMDNMGDILLQKATGLDILAKDDLLETIESTSVLSTAAYRRLADYIDSLAHADPSLSILEVGAGRGRATRIALDTLSSNGAIKRYKDFTITDIANGVVSDLQQSLAPHSDLKFATLDIEANPAEQGFSQQYDVLIISQCLRTTRCVSTALSNCRGLLRPGSKIVILETTRPTLAQQLLLGALPGYWIEGQEERTNGPFLGRDEWEKALSQAGFSGLDMCLDDFATPHSSTCVMVSTARGPASIVNGNATLHLSGNIDVVYGSVQTELMSQVIRELTSRGTQHNMISLETVTDSTFMSDHRVIAFLEADDVAVNVTEQQLQALKAMVRTASTVTWVTSSGLMKAKNAEGALIPGLLRTLGTEISSAKFIFIDYDPEEPINSEELAKAIVDKEERLQHDQSGAESEDRDFAWQDGCFWVGRLVPDTSLHETAVLMDKPASKAVMLPFHEQGPLRADFETPGILSSLYFKAYEEAFDALPDDYIQVRVVANGLNWKDLATSSGRLDQNYTSCEYAGIVESVGSAVNDLSIGDKVFGVGKGHSTNIVRVPAAWALRLQPDEDLVQLASIPLAYATTIWAFEHVTRIRKGEKVMIQSAAGGVGLAAVRFAQAMGAEVFATVGNDEKAEFLKTVTGLDDAHIFPSRGEVNVARLLEASSGGFDVMLGAVQGDVLHEYLRAMAPMGRYIDIGRGDVQNSKSLPMQVFQRGISFTSFDLADVPEHLGKEVMASVGEHLRAGRIGPIPRVTLYDIAQLDKALLSFSKGTHIGKIVMTYHDPTSTVRVVPPTPRARFSPEKQSVIVGGLGGLGRSVVGWMADRGCRHFLVLSRSGAQSPEATRLISTLSSRGITVRSVRCDVGNYEQVSRVIAEAAAVRPLEGIVHAAVSYQVSHLRATHKHTN